MNEPPQPSGLTLRSLAVGIIQVLLVCLGAPYAIWVLGSSEITWSFFPIGVGFPFLCLILFNGLLKKARPGWAFRPQELITVAVMGLVVIGVPIFMMGFVLAIPTTPHYFASPENQWGTHILPHLPAWLIPSNEGLAMTWFFEGLPYGVATPWGTLLDAWVMPLFWWLSFIFTLYFVSLTLVVILRRQWVERERLSYPLTQVPLALVEDGDGRRLLPTVMGSRLFWIGLAIPLFIALWNIVGFFYHFFPRIEWQYPVQIAHGFPSINVRLYFPVIGFMYFVNLNVTFSIWFFYVFTLIEEGLINRFGLGITKADAWVWGLPSTSWQCWGAFVAMVLWGLWMARDHLRDVALKAWNRDHPVDDSRELLPYRVAVIGILLGLVYMICWLHQAGMSYPVAILWLAFVLIAYLGITRLVVQAGIYYLTTPIVSQAMTMGLLGPSNIGASSFVGLGLSYAFFGDVQSIFMPSAAHATKLHDVMHISRRSLGAAILIALIVGFAATILYVITMAYDQGASNFSSWFFRVTSGAGVRSFDEATKNIKDPQVFESAKHVLFGIGAAAMSLLTFLQYRLPWWPLHPAGLAISAVWMIRNQAAAIFIAWVAKSAIMRFGGIELYRKAAPFFIGLILGHFAAVGISFIVDMIFFHGNGHPVLHG
ncbi:MAG: hypothetical protein QF689_10225 [Candidatus Latescibacteria bacterium]|nr:hypothetical protein [Candidatus Latescibacterota bacterium]MDP7448952.1 hypothetical protein [Candidatus Latescibacterota bacterium]